MKRLYIILSRIVLAAMLLVCLIAAFDTDATYSESERRKLKTKPTMTVSSLLDGSFCEDYRAYFADTFPAREGLKAVNMVLNGFYYFGGLGDDSALILDFSSNGSAHGEALKDPSKRSPPRSRKSWVLCFWWARVPSMYPSQTGSRSWLMPKR